MQPNNRIAFCLALCFTFICGAALGAAAQTSTPTITQLFSFPCDPATFVCADGDFPLDLIEASDGNFYGVTSTGGTGLSAQGTVFKITPGGDLTVIFTFAEQPDFSLPFGAAPQRLVEGVDGFLYGLNLLGGANGVGTVFKLSKDGSTIVLLHNFCNTLTCGDGSNPGFFMQALDGRFYGTTGPNIPPTSVLFHLAMRGTYQAVHTFDTRTLPDGTGAFGFVQAHDGNFYGTTVVGDQNTPFNTVFRFNPITNEYTILHSFNDVINAASAPVLASDGRLYGTLTESKLFRITLKGGYQQFPSIAPPQMGRGPILQASDGNLWSAFSNGTTCDAGSLIVQTNLTGSVLQTVPFSCNDGAQPVAMLQAQDGKIYGVTFMGGTSTVSGQNANGTVFVLDAGLPSPKPQLTTVLPESGIPGMSVLLQGSHFVGTTAVTVGGKPAKFKVLSANYIRFLVPPDVSTGPIAITNSGGTTTSVTNFTIE